MSLPELETAVKKLPALELDQFAQWFEVYFAELWDRRIEADIAAGRLDAAGDEAEAQFEAGLCKPL